MSNYGLEALNSQQGRNKSVFHFLAPCCGRQVSGAPVVDAELPSAQGQITTPPTPTTDCGKPAPYHRHWDFLIIYVT